MTTALGKWLPLGSNGMGWNGQGGVINWIAYLPDGGATQEGTITYTEAGINPKKDIYTWHSEDDLHSQVIKKAIPLINQELAKRTSDPYANLPEYAKPSWAKKQK